VSPARAEPGGGERRQGDRRRTDRRIPQGRRSEDSLFDAADGVDGRAAGGESMFDPGWLAAGDPAPDNGSDPRLHRRQARPGETQQDSALARLARTYTAARAVVGLGLVAAQGASSLLGAGASEWVALLCVVYAVQAISLWLLPRPEPAARQPLASGRMRPWLATLGVDLVCFAALHALALGASFNYGALLALPVLMAGVLTSRMQALGTAAAVALLLLAVAWLSGVAGGNAPALLLQAGLAGLGLFVITLLAGELAGRLVGEEQAARGSLQLARQQAQLNRLVIEEMADGVLVVDSRLRVRAANPAARALLVDQGLGPTAPFALGQRPVWASLARAVQQALADDDWPEAGRELALAFGQGHVRTLRMRVRFVRGRGLERLDADEDSTDKTRPGPAVEGDRSDRLVVVLLEDVRTAQARIRQERLAAMGRVSAGVAHEIRNPLAAIAQANALLLEDPLPPAQQRLAQMVADNVERLKRLVDDVMEVAPGHAPDAETIDATAAVSGTVADWARTAGVVLGPDSRLRCELPVQPLGVVFDPEHLRRVLVNLLDNALRHASGTPGSIFMRLAARDEAWAVISVLSDSPVIPPDVEPHLFEPFFSTRSRGSGLGLYICRELCERYGASIEYRPRPAAERLHNEFLVSMPRAGLRSAAEALPLDP
jgi:two-component system, NtrC family, sensor histidine kinase PilS